MMMNLQYHESFPATIRSLRRLPSFDVTITAPQIGQNLIFLGRWRDGRIEFEGVIAKKKFNTG
jgi:hypothetical protein